MEFTPTTLAFCLFASIVGVSLIPQIPSAASFSCGPGETQTESKWTPDNRPDGVVTRDSPFYCIYCQATCITQCNSQGREVSQLECNFWGSDPIVCNCCCGLPLSTPPGPPPPFYTCPTNEVSKLFLLDNSPFDCGLCISGCERECNYIGSTAARQVCFGESNLKRLSCPCCCKPNPPPSPPPPSPQPPSSPQPPPSHPKLECEIGERYSSVYSSNTDECINWCKANCTSTTISSISCTLYKGHQTGPRAKWCQCCCSATPPPPPPSPPAKDSRDSYCNESGMISLSKEVTSCIAYTVDDWERKCAANCEDMGYEYMDDLCNPDNSFWSCCCTTKTSMLSSSTTRTSRGGAAQ